MCVIVWRPVCTTKRNWRISEQKNEFPRILSQAAQTLFVIYIHVRDSIALYFEPFNRMYEPFSYILLNGSKHNAILCSSECDKISSLPVFYVDEKFTHWVIYFYVKLKIYTSSLLHCYQLPIILAKKKNIFVDQVSCFNIKFLIFALNRIFPLSSQLRGRN